jgi:Zn-dependent peptidase ImmA (M78 family)/transcriptional regulator with XRE-family HTH domain
MNGPQFNAEILSLTLDARATTATELAARLKVTGGLISKWLNGISTPPDERVAEIADALHYPVELFYRGEHVRNTDSVCFHHRKRQSMPTKQLRRIEAEMHLAQLQMKWMLYDVDIDAPLEFSTIDVAERGGFAGAAQALRSFWRTPAGPIDNLTALVESAGASVITRPFQTTKLDGMSCWAKGTPPVFFLNAELPTDRQRWTLAHELGHLVLHATPPEGDPELEAEDFAREFLLPSSATNGELRRLTFQRLPALKREWRVPMREIIATAARRGLLPTSQIKSLSVQFSRAGWHGGEKYLIDPEVPRTSRATVDLHVNDHGYTSSELALVAGLCEDDFVDHYQPIDPEKPRLRLA